MSVIGYEKSLSMLKIQKWVVNPCQECTHVVFDETGEAVIIDCGAYYPGERRHLLEYIEKERLHPVRLLLTHAHHDHLYGNDLIQEHFGLLPEVHEGDKGLMEHMLPLRIKEIFGDNYPYPIPMPERYLKSGEIISFGNHELKVIHTPGHTPGSVVFQCWSEKIAFTGDTLLSMNIGRTDFPGGDREQMAESLELIVHRLSDDTVIYPGHGKKSTMMYEKACNPYLLV